MLSLVLQFVCAGSAAAISGSPCSESLSKKDGGPFVVGSMPKEWPLFGWDSPRKYRDLGETFIDTTVRHEPYRRVRVREYLAANYNHRGAQLFASSSTGAQGPLGLFEALGSLDKLDDVLSEVHMSRTMPMRFDTRIARMTHCVATGASY